MSLRYLVQASVLVPSIFIAQEPQTPSRQERRKVSVGSLSFLILMRASRTIGPQPSRSTSKLSTRGLAPSSGFQQQRSEERRVGKAWVSTCRSRGSPNHKTKTTKTLSDSGKKN